MRHTSHVTKARARLLMKSPFFGTILVSSPMRAVRDPRIQTAATDMISIFYNPDWFESLPMDEVIGVMAHEVLHIALLHGFLRGDRNPKVWNMACDYAVNLMLVDCGFSIPRNGLFDRQYKGMSAAQIYDLLIKRAPPHPRGKHGQGGPDGDPVPGIGSDVLGPGEMSPDVEMTAAQMRQEVQGRVAQAITAGRMAGNLPGDLARVIDSVLHPDVPWQDLLRPMVRSVARDSETWARRNRRFTGVYLPSHISERVGKIVVIGDTSGSITDDDLRTIGGAVIDIAEEVTPETIHVLWADAAVAGEQVFDCGDPIRLEPKGGGGTDMRVPLRRAAELEPAITVLVTDGHTPWPDTDPGYPLIVLCTTQVRVPIGQVVRI